VVTDGYDSSSIINIRELLRRANDANVTIYSITIPNYMPMMGGKKQRALTLLDLSELIPHTGGMDYSADTYDFTPIFKSIKEELAASYTVAYYPSAASRADGKFHSISVKISKPGMRIRLSRQGFFRPGCGQAKVIGLTSRAYSDRIYHGAKNLAPTTNIIMPAISTHRTELSVR